MMACITVRILLAKQFNHTSRIPIFQMAMPFGKLKPSLGLFFIIESVFTLSIIGLSLRKGEGAQYFSCSPLLRWKIG